MINGVKPAAGVAAALPDQDQYLNSGVTLLLLSYFTEMSFSSNIDFLVYASMLCTFCSYTLQTAKKSSEPHDLPSQMFSKTIMKHN